MSMNRKRRGRGEGSIFERGDGLWTASVSLGYGADGRRRRRTIYGKTKSEVQKKLTKVMGESPAALGDATRQSVAAYLDRWLVGVKTTVQPGTYAPYERHVRLHISPHIGGVKLSALTAVHVRELYKALSRNGVSPALAKKVGTTLTTALGAAVEDRLLTWNAGAAIHKPLASKPDVKALDPDQVALFLRTARKDRHSAFYVTALDTGMRPGELFALEWPDVDLDKAYLTVTKSLEDISGRIRVKEVKTKKGKRRIDLAPFTVAALREHRKQALAVGHISGPVFSDTRGGHLRISNLRKNSFRPIIARANALAARYARRLKKEPVQLPNMRLYDLRHTSATLLLLADESPKVVSERLGHASIQLTLDTYSHVLPTMQRRAADKMHLLLSGGSSANIGS